MGLRGASQRGVMRYCLQPWTADAEGGAKAGKGAELLPVVSIVILLVLVLVLLLLRQQAPLTNANKREEEDAITTRESKRRAVRI